jgi:outer membrane protein assembly factor BamB
LALTAAALLANSHASAENWPRWRGPQGNAVSSEAKLPLRWSERENVAWKADLPGEGSSSPIVWDERVFVAYARELGNRRGVLCLDRSTGKTLWTREITDENPEIASSLTGHAAATPATDGQHVVAAFGNAGVVCYDFQGALLWHRRLGEFESELGLASSPVIHNDRVFLVCDHDGSRFRSFDSFLIALDLASGETRWKTERPGLFRSWSTPILAPVGEAFELVVSAQDELRGYDPGNGDLLWRVTGMSGWVAPSPVFAHNLIFATSGKDGPTMAVRPGGRGDVTETQVAWQHARGAPYVCSPLVYGDFLYVHTEQGVLTCRRAATGEEVYRRRLDGKFSASAVSGDGKIYLTSEAGETFVLKPGETFEILAKNSLGEECLASPAISNQCLFLRTDHALFCIR